VPDHRTDAVPSRCPTPQPVAGQTGLHAQAARALADLANPRQPRNEPGEPLSSRAPKVLCVDDNPANLLLVQTLLEDMGAKVLAVESGYAAVKAVQSEPSTWC
jgi:PleD family two-component response regulator